MVCQSPKSGELWIETAEFKCSLNKEGVGCQLVNEDEPNLQQVIILSSFPNSLEQCRPNAVLAMALCSLNGSIVIGTIAFFLVALTLFVFN